MSTKVITGTVRLSYLNVFKPKAISEGQDPKFSVCLLIPKDDKATLKKIRDAIEKEKKAGAAEKWKGKVPANLKTPLRDGDVERADEHPEYAGMYFINANATKKPVLLDEYKEEILDQTELYSGCWGRANVSFYSFDVNGNRGIAVGLNALQKKRDDEPLGGTVTIESAAADFDDEDDDDMLG
ncbi:DUF2815 family protein [Blautia sp. JLR.GB0024]|uniref:DUF2815 family protein n=1 Tax=Blautia sp. JLR.GB0024 TaxID=3123295 RepID=UPI00300452CA